MSKERVVQLFQAIGAAKNILILPHNNPDPDAIASAYALHYLLKEKIDVDGKILYRGLIGRAENKALVRYLDHSLALLKDSDLQPDLPIALIDTQPGSSNNPVPAETAIAIVIDHHIWHDPTYRHTAIFTDVRSDLGATSTILTEYAQAAGVELSSKLATVLFYGIKTSTMGLGRNTTQADAHAYYYLQPRINVEALATIETARVPPYYFKSFDATLRAAKIYDGMVIAYIGPTSYPDLTAEMADLLLRLEDAQWVICMGVYEDTLILSVRTRNQRDRAGKFVRAIFGAEGTAGGHGTMAGGQLPLANRDPELMAEQLTLRALQYLNISPQISGRSLIVSGD